MEKESSVIKIAYITADWNRELVTVALDAVRDYLDVHPKIRVQVFNCFGFSLRGADTHFRYKIYDLPDFRDYDAVIIQSHQIVDSSALKNLENRIAEAGIPAISIGTEMKHAVYIGTDDYGASAEMTAHLIDVHHARTFLYVNGLEREGYGEAYDRRKGFEDTCRKAGIRPEDIRYYDGDWCSESGMRAALKLIESGEDLPDAIICASDEMALGVIGSLKDAGFRIPEDTLVTGFDGVFSASLSDPGLSTIARDFPRMIRTALDLILQKLENREVPSRIYSPYTLILSESCGCSGSSEKELLDLRRQFYAHSRRLDTYYARQDKLTAGLFAAEDEQEIMSTMESCGDIFGSPHMYLFLNHFYNDLYRVRDIESGPQTENFSDQFVLCGVGGTDMSPARKEAMYASSPQEEHLPHTEKYAYRRIARKDLTEASPFSDEQFTIFYPMYFEGIMIGFLVLTAPPSVTEMNLHEIIINLFVFALENMRRKLLARKMHDTLDTLSVTDPLTGLYNRFGYDRFGEHLFGEIRSEGHRPRVLFLDIDNMKEINDVYGHITGDTAIRSVARLIKESCRKTDFKMRYGVDEFLIITDGGEQEIQRRFGEKLDALNKYGELSFPLHVSIGCYIASENEEETPREILIRADELMYEVKNRKR